MNDNRRKRQFIAPPDDSRCTWDRLPLRDGTGARCMKWRLRNGMTTLCAQHENIAAERGLVNFIVGKQKET